MRTLTITLLTTLSILVLLLTGCTVVDGSGNAATETRDVANFDGVSFAGDGTLVVTQDGTEALTIEADGNILPVIETYVRRGTLFIGTKNNTIIRPVTPIRYTLSVKNIEVLGLSGNGTITADTLDGHELDLSISGDGRVEVGRVIVADTFAAGISGNGTVAVGAITADEAVIDISGDGEVTIGALTAQELTTEMSGNGSTALTGEVATQSISISGDGRMMADALRSSTTEIDISGNADIAVWVLETLDVTISGDGRIAYRGNPRISQQMSGNGELVSVAQE